MRRIGLLLFFYFTIFCREAHAYLDPGTGSYFFQMLIAAMLGGLFAVKIFWKKILFFFKNLFSRNKRSG